MEDEQKQYVVMTLVTGETMVASFSDDRGVAFVRALTHGDNPDGTPHLGWGRFPGKDGKDVVLRFSSVVRFSVSDTKPEELELSEKIESIWKPLFGEVKP